MIALRQLLFSNDPGSRAVLALWVWGEYSNTSSTNTMIDATQVG
jgi:hypothetical protein